MPRPPRLGFGLRLLRLGRARLGLLVGTSIQRESHPSERSISPAATLARTFGKPPVVDVVRGGARAVSVGCMPFASSPAPARSVTTAPRRSAVLLVSSRRSSAGRHSRQPRRGRPLAERFEVLHEGRSCSRCERRSGSCSRRRLRAPGLRVPALRRPCGCAPRRRRTCVRSPGAGRLHLRDLVEALDGGPGGLELALEVGVGRGAPCRRRRPPSRLPDARAPDDGRRGVAVARRSGAVADGFDVEGGGSHASVLLARDGKGGAGGKVK